MNSNVQNVMQWLEGNTNKSILIQKQEDGDADEVRLRLSKVGYRDHAETIDGYVGGTAVVLHGEGSIVSDSGEVPLPADYYVIPVDGLSIANSGEGSFSLKTDRAEYSISVQ